MHQTQGDWLPARAALHPAGLYFSLREIEPAELQDAFMQETIARLPARETIVQIDREDVGKDVAGSAPAGLIFHVARCGSTLISQLLKQHDGLVVYAEPLPVNEILLPPHKWLRGELVAALRSLGAAFARHARRPYVLKFTSWNTLFCDIVAEAFPESPWILNFRDPVEVGVSLLRLPAGWIWDSGKPAAHFSPFVDPQDAANSREEYVARLYGAFCRAAARLDPRRGRLVPYESLPAAAWDVVAPHFSLSIDSRQRDRMAHAAARNAKAPFGKDSTFVSDVAEKQAAASGALRGAIDEFARPRLKELERLHGS
ncbi:MAG: hypothetical protein ACRETI_01300 [Steroidobacteraceae bacterium]